MASAISVPVAVSTSRTVVDTAPSTGSMVISGKMTFGAPSGREVRLEHEAGECRRVCVAHVRSGLGVEDHQRRAPHGTPPGRLVADEGVAGAILVEFAAIHEAVEAQRVSDLRSGRRVDHDHVDTDTRMGGVEMGDELEHAGAAKHNPGWSIG